MIDMVMYGALGFLIASLLGLMLVPAFWNRAVRLTMRRIESTMPMSIAEIEADKDQLRAEFAIELRQLEVALEKAKEKAARELVEANKRRIEIVDIRNELEAVSGRLQEKENANRVLEQTIRRRLPELESRLKAAKEAIVELERANAELRNTVAAQAEALKVARVTAGVQPGDADQLSALSARRASRPDAALVKENKRLNAELARLRQELASGTASQENELLRQELGRLAEQLLATTQAEAPSPAPRVAMQDVREPSFQAERREPLHAGDDGRREPVFVAIPVQEPAKREAEERPREQRSLARMLSARRPKRRGSGHGESLSERLKRVAGAEASDV